MSFWGELKRRNVFRVCVAYAVVAWLLIQIADTLLPTFGAPGWVLPVFTSAIILGLPVVAIFAWAFELTPDGVRTTASADSEPSNTRHGHKLNYAITGLLIVAVAYMFVDNYVLDGTGGDDSRRPGVTIEEPPSPVRAAEDERNADERARTTPPNSVAVLPFDNLSPDEDNSFFAAGMHEEVLNQLAKLKNLRVTSRTSMLRYADSDLSVPEIARELNVSAVMEGSVRYANDRVRITAQLIDAETDQHIWSDSYDRDLADVFAIQADIAMNIANAMLVEFTPDEQDLIESVPTESPEAYALFLRALEIADFDQEMALLSEAVTIDPGFAAAYARMASTYALAVANSDGGSAIPIEQRNELEARGQELAERALAIDPNLFWAHGALAQLAMFRWRWTEALATFERGREVAPNRVAPHEVMLLSALGRHDEALALAERARQVQPDNPNAGWYGFALGWAGDYNGAANVLERLVRQAPRYLAGRNWLVFMEIARGNPQAAIVQLEFTERIAGDRPLMVVLPMWTYAYGRVGRSEDAQRLFDAMQRAVAAGGLPGAGGWAMAHLGIGDEAGALEWLEAAAEKIENHEPDEGFFSLIHLRRNITNDPVLRQPEFTKVLDRIRGD